MELEEAVENSIKARRWLEYNIIDLREMISEPEDLLVTCPKCGEMAYPEPEVIEYGRENFYHCIPCGFSFEINKAA